MDKPELSYQMERGNKEINNVDWCRADEHWVAICNDNILQTLKV